MTHSAERKQGDPEARQREDKLRILPFQPRRAMRANEPPPSICIEDKRGHNFVGASRALRHGRFPPFALDPTVAHPFYCVNGTRDSLCLIRTDPCRRRSLCASGTWRRASTVLS